MDIYGHNSSLMDMRFSRDMYGNARRLRCYS